MPLDIVALIKNAQTVGEIDAQLRDYEREMECTLERHEIVDFNGVEIVPLSTLEVRSGVQEAAVIVLANQPNAQRFYAWDTLSEKPHVMMIHPHEGKTGILNDRGDYEPALITTMPLRVVIP